jgi:RHS repeat-associated protein
MRSTSTVWGETRVVDHLQYQYNGQGHRLTAVNDQAPAQPIQLANFRDSVQQIQEYQYDANGNLIQDNNKGFTATWNLLDKPETISFTGNRQLRYVYDATGQRLQKWVTSQGVHTSTSYIGGLLYHNDTLLLEFAHDAGRTRRNRHGRLVNDFFIIDHLGNTRMLLTAERDTFTYHNTYESPRTSIEQATWLNRQPVRDSVTSTTPFFNTTGHACITPQTLPCPNHWASRLNGSVATRRVGTGIVLRVMAGDTLNYSTRAIYTQPHGSGWNTAQSVANMLAGLVGAFVGAAPATFDGKAHLLTNGQTIINTTAFQSAIQHQQQNTPANNTPRAFIKALFFNEQLQLTDSALIRISRGANTVHTYSGQRTALQNGYVYVYVTNESGRDIWFDDLMVSHRTGPLLQEAHFYPFGQEISPLSSKALLKTPNDRMLQQNEWDEEFGMNLHDFDARLYDASIGRFWGVDVYAEKFARLSPYNYAANNPYHFADPDGRIIFALAAKFVLKAATKAIIKKLAMKAGAKAALAAPAHMKFGASLVAYIKTTKSLKIASSIGSWAGGASNVARNWDRITASGTGEGIFRAANFFLAGSAGGQLAAIGTPLATLGGMVLGGALNVEADFITMDATLDSREGLFRSFSRGALSALSGKAAGKMFSKGMGIDGGGSLGKLAGKTVINAVEKGTQNLMSKFNQYGFEVASDKKYGKKFYWNAFWTGASAGGLDGVLGGGSSALGFELSNSAKAISFWSIPLQSIAATGIKNHLMYSNSNKEYRKAMNNNRISDSFWSLLHLGASIMFYSEGAR